MRTLETKFLCSLGAACAIGASATAQVAVRAGVLWTMEGEPIEQALVLINEEGRITAEWKVTENGRRAKFYKLTRLGRQALDSEAANWERLSGAISHVIRLNEV